MNKSQLGRELAKLSWKNRRKKPEYKLWLEAVRQRMIERNKTTPRDKRGHLIKRNKG